MRCSLVRIQCSLIGCYVAHLGCDVAQPGCHVHCNPAPGNIEIQMFNYEQIVFVFKAVIILPSVCSICALYVCTKISN